MNNTIKAAISAAAGKIFKMKTSQKIAIGAAAAVTAAAAGLVIAKGVQAKKQDRSVKSLVLEDATRTLPVSVKREPSFEESMEKSAQPFVLPQAVRKRIGLRELDDFEDTFVLEPKNKTTDDVIFYLQQLLVQSFTLPLCLYEKAFKQARRRADSPRISQGSRSYRG